MRHCIIILLLLLLQVGSTLAQTYEFKNRKYKGAYADGQVRSWHGYVLGNVKCPAVVCEGDTARLSLKYEGTAVCDYGWYKVGSNSLLSDSSSLVISRVSIAWRGKYFCRLRDWASGRTICSDTVELNVRKTPVSRITPEPPLMVCYGDTLSLSALASENDKEAGDVYAYSWSGQRIVTSADQSAIRVSPRESSDYKVIVTNEGCKSVASVHVEVYKPEVLLPGIIYLAQDQTLKIPVEVPPTASLEWNIGGAIVKDVNPLLFDGITEATEVTLKMKDRGCVAEGKSNVYFKRGRGYKGGDGDGQDRSGHSFMVKEVTYTPVVCENAEARFSVGYEGTFVCDYQWRKIGSDAVLGDSSVLLISGVSLSDRGKYYCILTDLSSKREISSDTVSLQIKKLPVPVIGTPVSPKLICYGDSIVLNATATENGKEEGDEYQYSWTGGNFITSPQSAVVKVAPQTTTDYVVEVRNDVCASTARVQIIVYKPEINIPDYLYISEGNSLTLKADVPAAAKLIWNAEGNVFENLNPFVYPDIRKTMEVTVKMVNEGCVAEDKCKVYVKRGRGYKGGVQDGFDRSCVPPRILTQNKAVASCVASDAWLEVIAEGNSIDYLWQKFNDDTKQFETFVPASESNAKGMGTYRLDFSPLVMADNGVYLCKLLNECGEVVTDTFTLSVGGVPVLKSKLNKEWDQCVDGKDSTFLNVVAIDPLGENLSYSWYKVDTVRHSYVRLPLGVNNYDKPYLKLLLNDKVRQEGFYLINVENRCGRTRDSVFIPVNTPIVIVPGSGSGKTITTCVGQNAEFSITTVGGGKVQYKLMKITRLISQYPLRYEAVYVKGGSSKITLNGVTKSDEGNYVWEVNNGCGRDTSDIIALRVEEPPVITSLSQDVVLCAGQRVTLSCVATSDFTSLNFEWLKNGKSTGVFGASYTIGSVKVGDAGNYVCRVSNNCPAVESNVIKVEVKDKPVILDRPYIRSSYCEGDSLKLKVEISGLQEINSMQWYRNNQPLHDIAGKISGSGTKILSIDSVASGNAGSYKIGVQNNCGINYSEEAQLVVDQPARFVTDLSGYTDLVLCDGANQALTVAATGATPIRYIWTHNAAIVADGFSGTINLNNVKADTAGLYCCEIQNRCGGKVACAAIQISRPDTFRFELSSPVNQVCAGDLDGLTAVLMGSDTNTLYRLYREPGKLVTEIHGRDLQPQGGFIEFRGLMGGTYYVTGEDTKYKEGCVYRMPGTVTVTEFPQPLSFKVFIWEHLCKGNNQASIGLSGSEKDLTTEYTLKKLDGSEWRPYLTKIRGTGDTLVWKNIPEGSYKVTAKNTTTGCGKDMEGIVEIVERNLPEVYKLYAVDSIYCANAVSDVVLQLSGMEAQTKYTLFKEAEIYRKAAYANRWSGVEKGTYSVLAENSWGCRNRMGEQRVIAQQPPKQTFITGGFVYCKDQTGTGRIEINNTDQKTLYRVYRESPKIVLMDTMGNGGSIFIEVPLEDKTYYVVAQDTTPEQCKISLQDTAIFRKSRLEVVGNPSEHYIPNGTSCQLSIGVSGQVGHTTFSWTPSDDLQDGHNLLQNPQTRMLTRRKDFIVNVKDESACIATTTVSVIMTSGELACDIRETDRVTSPDTLNVCTASGIDLYAWVDGGTGVYKVEWKDENGVQGHGMNLQNYKRRLPGWLVLEVESGENIKTDSIWINTWIAPDELEITPSGLICSQKNVPVELNLNGTQYGVNYILSYSTDQVRYNAIDTVESTGGTIAFSLPDAYKREGYYQVRAEHPYTGITCHAQMKGIVEMRKGVTRFVISGDKAYCEGSVSHDTIRISGRETGVDYRLYRKPFTAISVLPEGNNMFVGNFGTGDYFVTATNGVCTDTLPGQASIIRNPRPEEASLVEAGGYCDGVCPEHITLSGAEKETEYLLYRSNFGQDAVRLETLEGSGTIVFGRHCEPGEYFVTARNKPNGCERIFSDRVRIAVTLEDVPVTGNGVYCDTHNGYTGGVKIATPQDGVVYGLYNTQGINVGVFDSLSVNGLYFNKRLQAGDYRVKAMAGTCSLWLSQVVNIGKISIPVTDGIIAPYTLCQGDGLLDMRVSTTSGYSYQLSRDSAGVVAVLGNPKAGTGANLLLGSFNRIGTYEVLVRHTALGCEWRIPEKYYIDKALQKFGMTGDTLYCAVDGGVVIGMDSTERDVKYILQKWNPSYSEYKDVDQLTGKGLPVAFKGYFPTGEYRVKAVRGCEKIMAGILNVRSKEMPADSTGVDLEGNGCVDSTIRIRLVKTEPMVSYTLYHDGTKVGETLHGSGLEWKIDPAVRGVYRVVANKENCLMTMPRSIEIDEKPSLGELKGDTLLCANLYGELYIDNPDSHASYTLYNNAHQLVASGAESGGRVWFSGVPVGTLYPVASRGNCVVTGKEYTIDSIAVPILADDLLKADDCVKRGEGYLEISGMVDTLHYVIKATGGNILLDQKGIPGDTLFSGLEFGQYCISAVDERSRCASDEKCVEIKEKVAVDSLVGDFTYCAGEGGTILQLSGSERGMVYQMRTLDGDLIEEISGGQPAFLKKYKNGSYLFRKERTGFMGGCFTVDTVSIDSFAYPEKNIALEVLGGGVSLCAGGDYAIELKNTQAGFRYVLVKDAGAATQQYIDTVAGTDGVAGFAKKLNEKGFYKVYAEPARGVCGRYLDTLFRIHALPRGITAGGCSYCVADAEKDSCAIGVSGLIEGVMYILQSTGVRDTLYGPGKGLFERHSAGHYIVYGEDMITGCSDTVAKADIRAAQKPRIFTLNPVCSVSGNIELNGSQGDTVKYYLYKNGTQIAGPISGNGGNISFGIHSASGTYKVKAISQYGCEQWMRDSATLYETLVDYTLTQKGNYCQEGTSGVTLKYSGSNNGWGYFLKKGPWLTDTLRGDGRELTWSSIEGNQILSKGKYDLYAYNACETRLLKSIVVQENALPEVFRIGGHDAAICDGEGIDIVLGGSQTEVTYILVYNSGREQELKRENGSGYPIRFGKYSAIGQYSIYGVVDSSGCRAKMDEKMFYPGSTPDVKKVNGADICLNGVVEQTIQLAVELPLQNDVNYYLLYKRDKDNIYKDTILAGETNSAFEVQRDTGCYYVLAEDVATGCRSTMNGQYCIGLPPAVYQVMNPGDTIHLCQGEEYCIEINGSDGGVKYILQRDRYDYGQAALGNGSTLEVGCVKEGGTYKVKAFTGDCWQLMDDSVIVVVHPLPGVLMQKEYSYCELGSGVSIGIRQPAYAEFQYKLYDPSGLLLDTKTGSDIAADHSGFEFSGKHRTGGYYRIEVTNPEGCIRMDSVKVDINPLPLPFEISSTNEEWICVNGSVDLMLDSSQSSVEYFLYQKMGGGIADKLIGRKYGTGKQLALARVNNAGEYYVEATDINTSCKNNMYSSFVLHQADTVRVYRLEGLRTGYCYTDAGKGSLRLLKSQTGVEYELFRDGKPTGFVQYGTGGELRWLSVDGKPCSNRIGMEDVGYIYELLARDTATGCEAWMNGKVGIVEETDPLIEAWHPNKDILRCAGQAVNFNISAVGCNLHYRWQKDGVVLKDTTEGFYNIERVGAADFGRYICEVSNSCGSTVMPEVLLKVRDTLEYLRRMEDLALCGNNGGDAVLNGYILNGTSHEWYRAGDESNILGVDSWYKIRGVQPSDAGTYVYRSSNECGTLTDTCVLRIDREPILDAVISRIDTVCTGSTYLLHVESSDNIRWYRDGVFTGVSGKDMILNPVRLADQGHYTVRVSNACGEKITDVARLYVDDTIRLLSLRPSEVVCEGAVVDLYVRTSPTDRVSYIWERAGVVVARDRSTYRVGPLTSADPEYTYWISYRNKCSSGRSSIRLTVSNKLEYKDPEPAVIACADPVRDTFIYVGHPSTLVASYQWYYQEQAEGVDPVRLEGEIYDTLRLALSTRNTGYYFCSIGEVCNPVTTNSCWFRVDSVPVIGGTLSDTTLCSGSSTRLSLSATGGGLTYEWNFLFRNDSTARHEYKNALFSSTGHDLLTNIGVRHDSCRIWCRVWNDCGEAYSDTMLLHVRPLRAAAVTPDTVRLYGTDPGSVVISLVGGSAPWTYSYTVNDGPEIKVEEPQWLEDTLSVTVEGHYRLTRLEDPVGCTILSGLPSFEVLKSTRPSAGITGGGAVCLGGTVSIQVEVRGAKAPCTVYIYRSSDGRPADELPVSNPLVLPASVRDTVFSFAAVSGETYYIQRFEYTDQGGIVREGVITSTRAVVTVSDKIPVRFTSLSSNHIGQCRPIDLLALLKPYVQGADGTKTPLSLADGKFLLDGRELPDKWWVESALSAGLHEIAYIYGGNSCSLTPEVELVVDTLFGHTLVPQYLCTGGGGEDFELDITGMAPFGVTLRKEWVEYGGVRKPASDLTLTLPSGVYRSPVSFLPEDSCLFYTVTSITDVHGCGMRSGLPLRDTVTQARRSEFSVEVRYPHRSGVAWTPLLLTYNIPSGDSLGVRFTRTAGSGKPWQVYIADNAHPDRLLSELDVYGADTIISLKAALTYLLRPGDGTCGQNPWNDQYLQLRHLDSGHVRVKALLEGAYSSSGRKMYSGIMSELPRYGLADFPASVRDRVIDWIEVEVRRSGGATAADVASLEGGSWVISRDTCLLLDDGTVVDRSGNDTLTLPHSVSAVGDNSGYIVLRHRNHLSVMSSGVVTLVGSGNKGNVRTVDFTKSANVYFTGSLSQHMTGVGSDVWALSAGEVNTNALISIRDPNIENAGVVPVRGYYLYDVNFDGKVDWPGWKVDSGTNVDWLMVMKNRNKFSEIKFGNE